MPLPMMTFFPRLKRRFWRILRQVRPWRAQGEFENSEHLIPRGAKGSEADYQAVEKGKSTSFSPSNLLQRTAQYASVDLKAAASYLCLFEQPVCDFINSLLRIIYLDLPDKERTYLLYLYGKDEAEDLTAHEKKVFKALVAQIKGESR